MTTRNHRSLEQLGGTYSLTATVMGWKHIFIKQKYLDCIIDSFRFHHRKETIYTVGYCIMPSHLHWIIKLNEHYKDISVILGAFKSYTAHEILKDLKNENKNFMPASNIKLFTTAVALIKLTPDFRFCTNIYRNGEISPEGVLEGDIIIKGCGDPAISGRNYNGKGTNVWLGISTSVFRWSWYCMLWPSKRTE